MNTEEWKKNNEIDLALYQEINFTLEATIDNVIGRDVFKVALEEHLRLMAIIVDKCLNTVKYRCSLDGTGTPFGKKNSDCHKGTGCGYECIQNSIINE
jgi:hypothetical protein